MAGPFVYVATLLSSASFGLASVFEQVGTRRVNALDGTSPQSFLPLLKQLPYTAGLLLDALGFSLFLVAVQHLPLFFVQSVDTGSVAVTALVARFILKNKLLRADYGLMAVLFLGLLLLGFSAAPETAHQVSKNFQVIILSVAVLLGISTVAMSKVLYRSPALTSFVSGLCFSGLSLASRSLSGITFHAVFSLLGLSIAIYGLLGLMLFSVALQRGSVTQVYAINFSTETIFPAVLGLLFLGDTPRHGLWSLMIIGLLITTLSTVGMALRKTDDAPA